MSLPPIFLIVILSYPTEILLSSEIVTTPPSAGVSFYETNILSTIFTVVPSTATLIFCLVTSVVSATMRVPYP